MKTAVYSWRLSVDRKAALEEEARDDGVSLSALLDRVTAEWIAQRRTHRSNNDAEQSAIRKRAMSAIGSIRGGDPARAERASELVRDIIARKHEKESHAFARTLRKTPRRAAGQAAGRTY